MSGKSVFESRVTYQANGKDQLGNMIGQVQPGDTVKMHIDGEFYGMKKTFFGKKKKAYINFLNTHVVGETAHLVVKIPKAIQGNTTLAGVIMDSVRNMKLGDAATVTFTTDEAITDRIHKGHHEDVPPSSPVTLKIDIFRVVRNGKEHRRPPRNGTSGAAMGGGGGGGETRHWPLLKNWNV